MKQVSLIVIGAGQRGAGYAAFAKHFPQRLTVVGVAEPRDYHREKLASEYDIPPENVAKDWREAFCTACYELGKEYPTDCNCVWIKASR